MIKVTQKNHDQNGTRVFCLLPPQTLLSRAQTMWSGRKTQESKRLRFESKLQLLTCCVTFLGEDTYLPEAWFLCNHSRFSTVFISELQEIIYKDPKHKISDALSLLELKSLRVMSSSVAGSRGCKDVIRAQFFSLSLHVLDSY